MGARRARRDARDAPVRAGSNRSGAGEAAAPPSFEARSFRIGAFQGSRRPRRQWRRPRGGGGDGCLHGGRRSSRRWVPIGRLRATRPLRRGKPSKLPIPSVRTALLSGLCEIWWKLPGNLAHDDRCCGTIADVSCGCSSMAEPEPSKLMTRVRFPSPAPSGKHRVGKHASGPVFVAFCDFVFREEPFASKRSTCFGRGRREGICRFGALADLPLPLALSDSDFRRSFEALRRRPLPTRPSVDGQSRVGGRDCFVLERGMPRPCWPGHSGERLLRFQAFAFRR